MKAKEFKKIGFVIVILITMTTIIQGYSVYEDYLKNKRLFIQEVQQSLDNSVEIYFADLAKSDVITLTDVGHKKFQSLDLFRDHQPADEPVKKQHHSIRRLEINQIKKKDDSTHVDSLDIITINKSGSVSKISVDTKNHLATYFAQEAADSLNALKTLTNKIVISITRDSLDYPKINNYLKEELHRNHLDIPYSMWQLQNDTVPIFTTNTDKKLALSAVSKSTFLPQGKVLGINFENASLIILKKGLARMLFSLFFIALISGVLLYLYGIIKKQKELSEIKNDLIGNITHEFKTPIATISAAMEGIQNFNQANDPGKTHKYMDISKVQLNKLNLMVEKLLETATIDSEKLDLSLEPIDLPSMLSGLAEKFSTLTPSKFIEVSMPESLELAVDPFHFENALSNLLDNAMKYGGDKVYVSLKNTNQTELLIQDNGEGIPRNQQQKIFEKFYRIPKGNIHDVKGFGIGLYYTKNVIEKHGGTITILQEEALTTFKIIFQK